MVLKLIKGIKKAGTVVGITPAVPAYMITCYNRRMIALSLLYRYIEFSQRIVEAGF